MKFTTTILAAMAITTCRAFAPQLAFNAASLAGVCNHVVSAPGLFVLDSIPPTALFSNKQDFTKKIMKQTKQIQEKVKSTSNDNDDHDNEDDDSTIEQVKKQAKQIQENIDESITSNENNHSSLSSFLEKNKLQFVTKMDVQAAEAELAKNWGWVMASGLVTMTLGFVALLFPTFGSGVAYDGTVLTLGAAGLLNLLSSAVRENGHKVKSALGGLAFVGLAAFMATHPATSLTVITLTIATMLAAEGLFEIVLAAASSNKAVHGRPWHLFSGTVALVAGLWLAASLPEASIIAPGVALGYRLTSNGVTKMAIGFAGKSVANAKKKQNK